jgi:hypothetical protein
MLEASHAAEFLTVRSTSVLKFHLHHTSPQPSGFLVQSLIDYCSQCFEYLILIPRVFHVSCLKSDLNIFEFGLSVTVPSLYFFWVNRFNQICFGSIWGWPGLQSFFNVLFLLVMSNFANFTVKVLWHQPTSPFPDDVFQFLS